MKIKAGTPCVSALLRNMEEQEEYRRRWKTKHQRRSPTWWRHMTGSGQPPEPEYPAADYDPTSPPQGTGGDETGWIDPATGQQIDDPGWYHGRRYYRKNNTGSRFYDTHGKRVFYRHPQNGWDKIVRNQRIKDYAESQGIPSGLASQVNGQPFYNGLYTINKRGIVVRKQRKIRKQ